VAALTPTLLLLYAGYFVSLRNTIVNVLEAHAIEASKPKSAEPAGEAGATVHSLTAVR
jgi:hypothetical protein